MDGLEAVELKLSEVLEDNESKRIDSEYFKKEYVKNYHILIQLQYTKLKDCTSKIDVGFVGSMVSEYTDNGIDFLQTQNINEFFVQINDCKQINQIFHDRLKKSQIHKEDILIARSGSFGKASIYLHDKVVNSSDIIIVRADNKKINSFFLTTFLNSSFGSMQLHRFASGGLQGHVNLTILEQLIIPTCFSDNFQEKIETFVKSAHQKLDKSKNLYREAEDLLLEELGLNDFIPSNECVAIKSFSESFGMSGRLDSEYYQLKYDDIIAKIKNYHSGYDLVKNQFLQNKTSYEKTQDSYDYIEISDVDVSNGEITPNSVLVEELPANAKNKVSKGDILVSKVRPYRGAVGIIEIEQEDLICSGAFTVLRESGQINKETLITLFRLSFYKELLLKYNVGTSYPVIKDEDVLNMPIPLIDENIQKIIADKIFESFTLRAESKRLLEEAKTTVERAIEEGE